MKALLLQRLLLFSLLPLGYSQAADVSELKNTALLGGETTVFIDGRHSFLMPSSNLPMVNELDFSVGNSFFRNPWVIAPASTDARDGLGPLFNTNACQNCHIKDGRGHAPKDESDHSVSYLVRLSIPESAERQRLEHESSIPEPTYGGQFQNFSIPSIKPEGKVRVSYSSLEVTLRGGEIVYLRKPSIMLADLNYGPLHDNVMMSPRVAPAMIGLGLIESIPEKLILAQQDENDANSDGVSGRVNWVWSPLQKKLALGRFGWKAGEASVREQAAAAFNGDLGITSEMFAKDDCTNVQSACLDSPNGGEPEVSENILSHVTFYSQNLAVPARRNINDVNVQRGQQLFVDLGCALCHRPSWKTAKTHEQPWLADQTIYPYTDLLLHDMGEGLADHRPEFAANGFEWRTPPLWGIGLSKVVNPQAGFLHDGRARTLKEAIVWHGGEAEFAKQGFIRSSKQDRDAILAFLNNL